MKKILIAGLLISLTSIPVALSAAKGDPPTRGCDQANENDGDPYDSTCDGSPSENGQGGGNANGKPCAGCVGAADNKNPKGQFPDGTDNNNGYECDGNKGVGVGNPAHTLCDAYSDQQPAGSAKTIKGSKASFEDPGSAATSEEESGPTGAMLFAFILVVAVALGASRLVPARARKGSRS